jgi:hypothetical protein
MSKLETNTIDNISGSSTLTVGDSNTSTISIPKNITLGASGTTITVPSGATITNNGTQTGFGGTNTPMFFLNKTDTQSISNNTTTKVTFNSELIDTDSAVSSSTFTVPSGEAGKYFFVFTVTADSTTDTDYLTPYLYHQGGVYARNIMRSPGTGSLTGIVSGIIDLSVGETVEAYVRQNTGGSINISGESAEKRTTFTGYKLIS